MQENAGRSLGTGKTQRSAKPLPLDATRTRRRFMGVRLQFKMMTFRFDMDSKQQVCQSCMEAHAILDDDDSKIIRNEKDGYPEGREPRELTLAERVKTLCVYAADWKRWCENGEK